MVQAVRRWISGGILLVGMTQACPGFLPEATTAAEFQFAGDLPVRWRMERSAMERHAPGTTEWREAVSDRGTRRVRIGSRVVLQVRPGGDFPADAVTRLGLTISRTVGERLWILQARDPWAAATAAQELAGEPGVEVSVPVMRRDLRLHGRYAPMPNDPYFIHQWHLENRDDSGVRLGPDLEAREAWASSRGEGVLIAICDDGFETEHPDLAAAASGAPHYDFETDRAIPANYGPHSTCVAGLAAARGGNGVGVAGVAPAASLASWAIFNRFGEIVSDEALMDMFQHALDRVDIQNHSWGNAFPTLSRPSAMEAVAISNAIENGRGGRGVLIVRSAGNGREITSNVNDDGYANDPRVIAVGAVRQDGRAASYSTPGAALLVSAPSGDDDDPFEPTNNLFTTDRVGSLGYNSGNLADYAFDETGFSGTSASAPQVSGVVALMLAANPALTYRDVQQILVHSSRIWDRSDPDLRRNGAGFEFSHNHGYGVPDAGRAVELARTWSPRPPLEVVTVRNDERLGIPDDGYRVVIRGADGIETAIRGRPARGPRADDPTPMVPLVFVGYATNQIDIDLSGRAALIERGGGFFRDKIQNAARAGAEFALLFNNEGGDELLIPSGTDFVSIPAFLVSENQGRGIVDRMQRGEQVLAQLRTDAVHHAFTVTNTLICEHVGLRVRAAHNARGDVRITLVSPQGTRSVLQEYNDDLEAMPDQWTYWSTRHFGESSAGTWTAYFSDEDPGTTGSILESELIIRGVSITDTDADGLDDEWEIRWFGGLHAAPGDDPDGDGESNAREQALHTDPLSPERTFLVDASLFRPGILRLSWPATAGRDYEVRAAQDARWNDEVIAHVPGWFDEAEWVTPLSTGGNRFFRVEEIAPGG